MLFLSSASTPTFEEKRKDMAFFMGLISISGLLWLIGLIFNLVALQDWHATARLSASIMFGMIGVMHFLKPNSLTYMIDNFLPYAKELIFLSGALEVLLAIGLLYPPTREISAWGLIGLLILMFPANINVAIHNLPPPGGLPAKPWYVWSRLAFQPLYIAWIWFGVFSN